MTSSTQCALAVWRWDGGRAHAEQWHIATWCVATRGLGHKRGAQGWSTRHTTDAVDTTAGQSLILAVLETAQHKHHLK